MKKVFLLVVAILFALPAMSKTPCQTTSLVDVNIVEEFRDFTFLCNYSIAVYNKDGKRIDYYRHVDGLENDKDCVAMAARDLAYYNDTYSGLKVVLTLNP